MAGLNKKVVDDNRKYGDEQVSHPTGYWNRYFKGILSDQKFGQDRNGNDNCKISKE